MLTKTIEGFQVRYHPGTERSLNASEDEEDDAETCLHRGAEGRAAAGAGRLG